MFNYFSRKMFASAVAFAVAITAFPSVPAENVQAVSLVSANNEDETPAPSVSSAGGGNTKKVKYSIGSTEHVYEGETIQVVYENKNVKLKKTPAIKINGVLMVPLKETFADQGIEGSYKYHKKLKKIKISKNNKFVIMHLNKPYITVNQKKTKLKVAPTRVTYKKSGVKTILVPFKAIIKALGINYLWDEDLGVAQLSKPVLNYSGTNTFTKYRWTLNQYAKIQKARAGRASLKEYKRLLNYRKDTSYGFQFLRLDTYRAVNEKKFISTFNYYIRNACENNGHKPSYSVLYNKGKVMLAAAKKVGIDPMYFASQTFIESGYGTSGLSRGNKITRVALPSYARSGGKFITKKIKKSKKVYNLYGIKAYDSDPRTGATSYAYYNGWTTINKAIYGAAKFIKTNYFQAKPAQNTIFKFRFNPSNLSHQYATGPWYSEQIAQRMMLFSNCYAKTAIYSYDYPAFRK
ncbi:N-acetylglucosaminidase [Eubacterium xylanophilum]|uniref:N-acetylglucosaminidase n=1 Tax=Eubacterium xylanophilum TaxID=39497 RepID=UPI00068419B2|nr:stalk domain-containing protein [Eubacterium xylanophilum]